MPVRQPAVVLRLMDNVERARKPALILSVGFSTVLPFEPALPMMPVSLDAMQPSDSASSRSRSMKPATEVLQPRRPI